MHRFFFIAFAFLLYSCRYSPSEPKLQTNYPPNISAIIEANCLGGDCHGAPTLLNKQFALSNWEMMTKGSIFGNDIIPFNPLKSHLFGHINTDSTVAPVISPS